MYYFILFLLRGEILTSHIPTALKVRQLYPPICFLNVFPWFFRFIHIFAYVDSYFSSFCKSSASIYSSIFSAFVLFSSSKSPITCTVSYNILCIFFYLYSLSIILDIFSPSVLQFTDFLFCCIHSSSKSVII